jgi:hypothetical protein
MAAMKAAKDDETRAKHEAALKAAQAKLKKHTDFIAGIVEIRNELAADLAAVKKKQDEAETLLSAAAEKKAAQAKAQQKKEYDAFYKEYVAKKTEYDGYASKEDKGTLTDDERKKMHALEA